MTKGRLRVLLGAAPGVGTTSTMLEEGGRLAAEGRDLPSILTTAGDRPFYRVENGNRQYLTTAGDYVDVPRADVVELLEDIKLRSQPVLTNASASLWDVGDGVAALEFHTKMNALDDQVIAWGRANADGNVHLRQPVPAPGRYTVVVIARGYEPMLGDGALQLTEQTPEFWNPWGQIEIQQQP